jgi:hypothetical protein
MAMYLEAEKLSQEVLEVYPRDEAAQSNAAAARNSIKLRSHAMGRVVPEVTARSSPVCAFTGLTAAMPWAVIIKPSVWKVCPMSRRNLARSMTNKKIAKKTMTKMGKTKTKTKTTTDVTCKRRR